MAMVEVQQLLHCLQPIVRQGKKNEFLTIAGNPLEGIGVLVAGSLVVTKENARGKRMVLTYIQPGEMFGEIAAFSGNGLWPATVAAQEDSVVLFLPPSKIIGGCKQVCESHRFLTLNMLKIISNKALNLNKRIEYMALSSLREKIGLYLWEEFQKNGSLTFVLPLKRNELAEFLNVTRPALSREMGRMRDEGIIDFHQASIKIKDLEALKELL